MVRITKNTIEILKKYKFKIGFTTKPDAFERNKKMTYILFLDLTLMTLGFSFFF